MKKSFIIMVLLTMAAVLIPACSKDKDEEEKTPTASFTVSNDSVLVDDTVYFTNTSTDATNYSWDFGDGSATSTDFEPTHIYTAAGDYTVTLTACSADSTKSDETTKIIKVNNQETVDPVASFTVSPETIYVNEVVTFTNTSTNAESYLWDFGDGESSTDISPVHSYSNAGNYTITLTAYSVDGTKSDEATKNIEILALPEASFTMSSNEVYVDENVTFTNTSTNAGSYLWDFGDEQTSTDISPVHSYSNAGNYTITLTAYSVDGTKSDETTASIQVNDSQGSNLTIQVNGVSFEMIYVEGGTFWMGAQSTDPNGQNYDPDAYNDWESPVHQVTLDSYYIGESEVTQELWQAVMGNNPSTFNHGGDYPVESVSWNDVQQFVTNLNQITDKTFSLPTEAQWEFAARGGINSQHYKYSGSNNVDDVAWYDENSGGKTHPIGKKQPNELGIYDMSGNVSEWVSDWFGEYSGEPQTNPTGPATGSFVIFRGSGWDFFASGCRVSNRGISVLTYGDGANGFRIALIP